MKEKQLSLLISNIMIGLSFLSSGWGRGALILLGAIWLIASLTKERKVK